MSFTNVELAKCAAREAALRRNVYKRHGKDTPADFREIEMMEAIAEHFKALDEQPNLWAAILPQEERNGERRVSRR